MSMVALVALVFAFFSLWYLALIVKTGRYITSVVATSKTAVRKNVLVLIPVYKEQLIIEDTMRYYSELAADLGVKVCFVTTEQEGDKNTNQTYKALKTLVRHNKMLSVRHCPAIEGAKAGQINWAINQMKSNGVDYFAIFDADSRPDKRGIEYVLYSESRPDIYQMPGLYLPHESNTLSSAASSVFQTRWSLCFEIPQWLKWEKNGNVPHTMYLVGHGLFIRNGLTFSENTITEDLELGYRLSAQARKLQVVPYFDYCRVPKTFFIGIIQSSRWYYGELTSLKLFGAEMKTQRNRLQYLRKVVIRYAQILLWLFGPWIVIAALISAILSSNFLLASVLVCSLIIYCYALHYVTSRIIGLNSRSLYLVPVKSFINSFGPILCVALVLLDTLRIRKLTFIKTTR